MTLIPLLIGSFTAIISIVNPFLAMPAFLALTENDSDARRRNMLIKACFYMVLILVTFFIAGSYIMNFYGISMEGMRIAGGLMVMQASYSMLNPQQGGKKITDEDLLSAKDKPDISFSPLAMPLLSGPGSIAVVLGLSSQTSEYWHYLVILGAILLTALTTFIILFVAPWFTRFLGRPGMSAMTRMMGFIGLCIGVQFIINGILPLIK